MSTYRVQIERHKAEVVTANMARRTGNGGAAMRMASCLLANVEAVSRHGIGTH